MPSITECDHVAHESPMLCILLISKSLLTSMGVVSIPSHPKCFAPDRRVVMQSFWGLYTGLFFGWGRGDGTMWATAVACPSCCQNVWRGLNNEVGDQSYFLLVYKLPCWDNRAYRSRDERNLHVFTLQSPLWLCLDSFFFPSVPSIKKFDAKRAWSRTKSIVLFHLSLTKIVL